MLAARLGVAVLIIIALSIFIDNRPPDGAHVMTTDVSGPKKSKDPKVTIGPLTIAPDATDREIIHEGIQALRESSVLGGEQIAVLEAGLERQRSDFERDAKALEADGLEIAQQLAATKTEPSGETPPDRLSETEIQNLVVQRLLSVQTQIRENEESNSTVSLGSPTPSPSAAVEPATVAPDTPTVSEASKLSRPKRTLERLTGSFAGKTHMGTDFRNKDLSGLDFSNARLTASEFDGSDLTGANFSGAKLHGASFADAIMDRTNLANAQAQTAHFERASMVEANLNHANLAGAVLIDADLRGATMESLNLNGANLQGTILEQAP